MRVHSGAAVFGAAGNEDRQGQSGYLPDIRGGANISREMKAAPVVIDGVHGLVWPRPDDKTAKPATKAE
ncbi:hypothetical protein [Caulobacter sp. BE254]|uniref:hypothetical protein n=1 Tax=Caulobacter sp. BE254 TaxID=2817720 RepID=UPI00285585DB|nr:hypothetical protein [Caulobacter sp. BE254]MDR7117346.1 hypothetical protein [Caulobacter sp. BE254]